VVSYNVHSLRDDRAALAAVVRELAPDVVLVQEAPRRFRWRARCAALAASFGLVVAAGGGPGLGNLILTHLRVRVWQGWCLRLPHAPGRHPRGVAFARCELAGAGFVVAGAHLSTDPAERPRQARLLAGALAGIHAPVVVGMDVNDEPGSVAWQALTARLLDPGGSAPTFPGTAPARRIDAILVQPGVTVHNYRVVDTPLARRASDHLPVVADLGLPAGPGAGGQDRPGRE
jgi:endonuclease/exonuclease/phosphatase family metal-dependent hydrolase